MQAFLDKLMQAAKDAGLEACEAYLVAQDSFRVMTTEGEILEYNSNATRGLGFRGMKNGRMGYSSTEAFDDEAIGQLVRGAVESAELSEDTDIELLYDGHGEAPALNLCGGDIARVTPAEKIDRVFAMEKAIKGADPRIDKSAHNMLQTGTQTLRIVNSYGMDRSYTQEACALYGQATAKDGDFVSSGYYGVSGRSFDKLNADEVGAETARRAIDTLNAKPVPSGKYHVVFLNEAMTDLLDTFCGIFSAEVAQKGMSLLKGKLGETIAAPFVTLVDDPLMPDGMESRPFDAEGVPSKKHVVVEKGVFKTFLHNLKTALKDGVETTGNASKSGYASSVGVAPSNFYFEPGSCSFDDMLKQIGDGLVITDVSGLHAGANPVSGDFSLLSKGYTFHNGKRGQAVEQITVAGNFYELLKSAHGFASDLRFPYGNIGSASLDAGEMSISGC